MKALTLSVMTFLVFGLVRTAEAASLPLNDGLYTTPTPGVCAMRVIGDEGKAELNLIGESDGQVACQDAGKAVVLAQQSDKVFADITHGRTETITAEKINKCRPRRESPKPCHGHLYDPRTGALLARIGDTFSGFHQLNALNPRAFRIGVTYRLVRDGHIVVTWEASQRFFSKVSE